MAFYLAVDAGGTKTGFLLADETRELARASTGTIKRMRADADTAAQNLDRGLHEVSDRAGVSLADIAYACIGAAGWTVPLVADWMRHAFAARLRGELLLVGDVEIALDAAFQGGPGVLVLAGTGSNVAGRSLVGEIMTVGGWGPALADQGSGHRIGHQALRSLFLAIDERQPTELLTAVLTAWELSSLEHLVDMANRMPPPDFSRLAEPVVLAAARGDAVAQAVLLEQARELAHLARLMLDRVYGESAKAGIAQALAEGAPGESAAPGNHGRDAERLAFAGSILEHVTTVRDGIIEELRRDRPLLTVTPGAVDPLLGALWRARLSSTRDTEG